MKKFINILLIIVVIVTCFAPYCYGADGVDDAIKDGDEFLKHAGNTSPFSEEGLQNFSKSISNMLLVIGVIVAVIVGSILGIKFMMSSVEGKAEVKKMLIIYVVGCAVLFGAFSIWKICISLFS